MRRRLIFLQLFTCLLFAGQVDICIDPGHGGKWPDGDPGVVNESHGPYPDGPFESDFNKYIAWSMEMDLVWGLGYSISMTRTGDENPSLEERVKMANGEIPNHYTGQKDTCQLFVSVHNDGPPDKDSTIHGTKTYYYRTADETFAGLVHSNMFYYISNFPFANDMGVRRAELHVLIKTKMPAVLTESAYVTHDIHPNAQWFQLKDNHQSFKDKIAWGIDDGIDAYYKFPSPRWLRILWMMQKSRSVNLEWGSCPVSVTGYNIYRRTYPDDNYVLIENNFAETIYSDNSVSAGGAYSYYVKGVRSGGQEGNRSEIATVQVPPFSSNFSRATGVNNARRILFDDDGISHLTWTNKLENEELSEDVWYSKSTDYGSDWSIGQKSDYGWQPTIDFNSSEEENFCYMSTLGLPDSGASDTMIYTVNYAYRENGFWYSEVLYDTPDSILSVSFAIDPLDTGWVVFNTLDDAGNNRLKIGQFYTQEMPESLENVIVLDTYSSSGVGAVAVRSSDRSIWLVYEKNGNIECKWRSNTGVWHNLHIQNEGRLPSVSIAGDLIYFIWEKFWSEVEKKEIQTNYTLNGLFLSAPQTIALVHSSYNYPYLENGSIAVWSDFQNNQWDIYASERNELGGWTTPQNISQSGVDSKYPQVAMYQTVSQTNILYLWTEGNSTPYEVKIYPTTTLRSRALPLYAFNLGKRETSVFNTQRLGYIAYGEGPEKSVDYDTSFLSYKITGLDSTKSYHLGLCFYQDEMSNSWNQEIEIDDFLIDRVEIPRKTVVFKKIILSKELLKDGVINLLIKRSPKVVCSALALWEFSKEDRNMTSVKELNSNALREFNTYASPNPSKKRIRFDCQLPEPGEIRIKIYTATGRLVREIGGYRSAGSHTITWNGKDNLGRDISTGIYFYRAELKNRVKTGKLILIR
ncbi:MAG TPA: T9SS type A sorting domain-containing protein [candidate division WOR-3 bacterium]|uniref:T9SS type A sorting domain-containing protein n=1 Tax=candidate division WOR-3 bacterium TaxID=2052148 RepID=A0A9C9EQ21_UNCW3|nr:T9SS type A sorting domain-containing protein [candidate division WOR-3 bacterium]